MKKKIRSMVFVLGLAGVMAVGCGNKNASKYFTDEEEALKPYYQMTGDDKDKDIELTWCVIGGLDDYYQYYWDEMKGIDAIEAITGVKIDFQVKIGYDDYLPMFSAQNYADVITAKHLEKYPARLGGMYSDGVSLRLDDYMEEWMPNFSKLVETYPDMARDLRLDDGSYTFVSSLYDVNNADDRITASQYGLGIRQDWLKKLGLEIPENMEEWHNVLLAFKAGDPNGNGAADEEPVCMASSGWKRFLAAYGIDDDPCIELGEDGSERVIYGFITDEYKEFLGEMKKWNDEGLIYNMFQDTSIETLEQKVLSNVAGAWKSNAGEFDATNDGSTISKLRENVPTAELAAVPWPKTKDGYRWCFSDISSFDRDTTVITANAKKHGTDKAAAYVIDYMLGEKGSTFLNWGIEGESYEVDEHGNKKMMEEMDEPVDFHKKKIAKRYTYADPMTVMLPQFGQLAEYIKANRDEGYINACRTWAEGDTHYKMNMACQLSAEQEAEVERVTTDMKDYVRDMRYRFVRGMAPLTEYDTYVAQVIELGGDEYARIWGEAYENYKNR